MVFWYLNIDLLLKRFGVILSNVYVREAQVVGPITLKAIEIQEHMRNWENGLSQEEEYIDQEEVIHDETEAENPGISVERESRVSAKRVRMKPVWMKDYVMRLSC